MSTDLEELYSRYSPVVFRRCLAILRDREEAWDGVQEVFLSLSRNPGRMKSVASPTAFLWRMATNYSLNRLKRQNRQVPWTEDERRDPAEAPEDRVLRMLFLSRLFSRVPERTRELAWYRWVDGLTWDEMALASGMSVSGVRKHLSQFTQYARSYKEHVS